MKSPSDTQCYPGSVEDLQNQAKALLEIELNRGQNEPTMAAIRAIVAALRSAPPGYEFCPSCNRLFKWGETCSRGGCPCGGDV